jgi:Parvulin-like peptidyl-prolyl isomerase
MIRSYLIRSAIVALFVVFSDSVKAQTESDSIIMTVAGKNVSLAEFEFLLSKNQGLDLSNQQSLESYIELFGNFKRKVAAAEELGLDNTSQFKREFERYKSELTRSYLSDSKGEDAAAKFIYDRGSELLSLDYIYFRLPAQSVSKDTLLVYNQAYKAYERIRGGESLIRVGESLKEIEGENSVSVSSLNSLAPLFASKAFENVVYSMSVGELSKPIRTAAGYYLVKLNARRPNSGTARVAHILLTNEKNGKTISEKQLLKEVNKLQAKILAGEDFSSLAKEHSQDSISAMNGGLLPILEPGTTVAEFENAAFSLENIGDISEPIKTGFGYHFIKLIEKQPRPSFEEQKVNIAAAMRQGEWNFEYYDAFDSRLRREYGYVLYPEAYDELQKICDDYFPTEDDFFEKAKDLNNVLFRINDRDFSQIEFLIYLQRNPFSTKTYSGDLMREVYDLFLRDLVVLLERENLETKHPEYLHLLNEYRDGILLFEISNAMIWTRPIEEQAELEKKWLEELKIKYPIVIKNWDLLKK